MSEKIVQLPLRQVLFFHRHILLANETMISWHMDSIVEEEENTFSGYMHLQLYLLHRNFPEGFLRYTLTWEITRQDQARWVHNHKKLEQLSGDRYDRKITGLQGRVNAWYLHRVQKIEQIVGPHIQEAFLQGNISAENIQRVVLKNWRLNRFADPIRLMLASPEVCLEQSGSP